MKLDSYVIRNDIELPKYSIKIGEQIEQVESINNSSAKFRDKCKAMYDFISSLIGKDLVKNEIGLIAQVDPNELNLLYLEIVESYNKPIDEFNEEKIRTKLDSSHVEEITRALESASKVESLRK